jgi:hypothetical protein
MADEPICPCGGAPTQLDIGTPPGRDRIDYRIGNFVTFRHALLRSLVDPPGPESELTSWQPNADGDLAVQMVEWWAYLGDILAFYNERIANETYLRTATLPENVRRLVRTIGYRPRPGIAAKGQLVALAGGYRPLTLPRGFSFDSKPGPGQTPQTFELDAATQVVPQGTVPANPPAFLLAPTGGIFLVAGSNLPISAGSVVLLRSRSNAFASVLMTVKAVQAVKDGGAQRSSVSFTTTGTLPTTASADSVEVLYPVQAMPVSTIDSSAISASTVHLAGVARDLHAGDTVALTNGQDAALRTLSSVTDFIWYANHTGSDPTAAPDPKTAVPIPVLHSKLVLDSGVPAGWTVDTTSVRFGWRSVGTVLDQPVTSFTGSPGTLLAQAPAAFPSDSSPGASNSAAVVISDATGQGMAGLGSSADDGATLAASGLQPAISLQPPLTVHYNLLPVSRGKTVATEILGSGDASVAGQEFVLKKSPLTYLASGDSYLSTLRISVDGRAWDEAKTFYRQPPDAEIFVTREDENANTHVQFGDGVNGARLPTGVNNVVATYRYGSGASSPLSGEITVINKPYPNLKAARNPVAVAGGADPDPPDQIRRLAPGSIMTFGRAVSGDDYEVIASRAPGVTRARAIWSFDGTEQRAAVKIYVDGDGGAVTSAGNAIATTGDPHRHVVVTAATQLSIVLGLRISIDGRFQVDDVKAALRDVMLDDDHGVFGVRRVGIGQAVFDSEIYAACQSCEGVISLHQIIFIVAWPSGSAFDNAARHVPGEGAVYSLEPQRLIICPEVINHAR